MSRKRSYSNSSSESSSSSSMTSSEELPRRIEGYKSKKKKNASEDMQCASLIDRHLLKGIGKKRERSPSSSSSSDDSKYRKRKRKERKKKKKEKKKLKKTLKKMKKLAKKSKRKSVETPATNSSDVPPTGPAPGPPIPELSDRAKAMTPMTKEEWDRRQQVIKKVYDEETGRHRLIRGDGEILEEIVSRDRHREINRQATKGDGSFFQAQLANKLSH